MKLLFLLPAISLAMQPIATDKEPKDVENEPIPKGYLCQKTFEVLTNPVYFKHNSKGELIEKLGPIYFNKITAEQHVNYALNKGLTTFKHPTLGFDVPTSKENMIHAVVLQKQIKEWFSQRNRLDQYETSAKKVKEEHGEFLKRMKHLEKLTFGDPVTAIEAFNVETGTSRLARRMEHSRLEIEQQYRTEIEANPDMNRRQYIQQGNSVENHDSGVICVGGGCIVL